MAERARLGELQLIGLEDRALARLWLGRAGHGRRRAGVAHRGLSAAGAAVGHCGRSRWPERAGRPTRWRCCAPSAELLDDELGLEPSSELRALQTAVLRQEPVLEWTVAAPQPAADPTPRTASAPPAGRRPSAGLADGRAR